jgi:hypothetical protein
MPRSTRPSSRGWAALTACLLLAVVPTGAILNPVLSRDADQYFEQLCNASAKQKLKDESLLDCPAVHAAHCDRWFSDPRPAAERAACKLVFGNLLAAFKSDIRANGQRSGMNPFQALVVLGGWHSAKDDWLKKDENTASPFHTVWDVPMPMMEAARGRFKVDEVFAGVEAKVRMQIVKKAMMGFMGDDRTATMWKLLEDCSTPIANSISEQNNAGTLPFKLKGASVAELFKMKAVGSVDPTSDFDISVASAVISAEMPQGGAVDAQAAGQAAKWRHSQTTAVVACLNRVFIPLIADPVNRELRRLSQTGNDAAARAAAVDRWSWRSILTSATFYDSNAYSEDDIPSEITSADKKIKAPTSDPGFVEASNHLTAMQAELRRDTRGVNDAWLSAAMARSAAVGRMAVSQTLDQLVWALLDEGTLKHVPNEDQIVPLSKTMTDGARGVPDLQYWPYGIAFKEGVGGAQQTDKSALAFDPSAPHALPQDGTLPLHLLARKAAFGHLLNHVRSCSGECLDASVALEDAVVDTVFSLLDAQTTKTLLPSDALSSWKTAKDDGTKPSRGPVMLRKELHLIARNIIYVEMSKFADDARIVKDYISRYHADDAAALATAVRAYYNLRALSLRFAAEAGRTLGVLWHVLPALQMGHPLLDLGLPLLLPAFVENAGNLQHQIEKIDEQDPPPQQLLNTRQPGGARNVVDTPCSPLRKAMITAMLDKGGKYLFRYTDALRRMDGGWRDSYPGRWGEAAYQRCDNDPSPAEVLAARQRQQTQGAGSQQQQQQQQSLPRLLSVDSGSLRGVAVRSSQHQQVLSAAAEENVPSHASSLLEVSAAVDVDVDEASIWSRGFIVPTTEDEFRAYLCGPTGVVSFNAPQSTSPQSECARAVLPLFYTLMDKSRVVKSADGTSQEQLRVAERLSRAARLMGGITQAYALLAGRNDGGPNAWEGARKKDNANVVREAFSADLALALKDPLPIYDQLLGGMRLTLAGGLSRMLGEGRCFAREGRIDDDCMPSLTSGCKFAVPFLPSTAAGSSSMVAAVAPAVERAAAETALVALGSFFTERSKQEAAAKRQQNQQQQPQPQQALGGGSSTGASTAAATTKKTFDWRTESNKLYDLGPRADQISRNLFDWDELRQHVLTAVPRHLARPPSGPSGPSGTTTGSGSGTTMTK